MLCTYIIYVHIGRPLRKTASPRPEPPELGRKRERRGERLCSCFAAFLGNGAFWRSVGCAISHKYQKQARVGNPGQICIYIYILLKSSGGSPASRSRSYSM